MEEFRELPDYPGFKIGNQGTIIGKKGLPLKPGMGQPYYHVSRKIDGKNSVVRIHRLVALAWVSNPENKPAVDHINRNKTDNRAENLRWVSTMENNNNLGMRNNNTSGVIGLHFDTTRNNYQVQKTIMGVRYMKRFQERQDAEEYLASLPN